MVKALLTKFMLQAANRRRVISAIIFNWSPFVASASVISASRRNNSYWAISASLSSTSRMISVFGGNSSRTAFFVRRNRKGDNKRFS